MADVATIDNTNVTSFLTSFLEMNATDDTLPEYQRLVDLCKHVGLILDLGYLRSLAVVEESYVNYEIEMLNVDDYLIPCINLFTHVGSDRKVAECLFQLSITCASSFIQIDDDAPSKEDLLRELGSGYSISDVYDPLKNIIRPDTIVLLELNIVDEHVVCVLARKDIKFHVSINRNVAEKHNAKHAITH